MEIRNHATNMVMSEGLQRVLEITRQRRGFNVENLVEAKIQLLNQYYRQAGLKSAVVAVSGGLDSAVVLGLVEMASRAEDSPIERIVAVTMPALGSEGVTGQFNAETLALGVCERFGVEPISIHIQSIVGEIVKSVEAAVGHPAYGKESWARGQAVSYARTPTYYYITSVMAAQGTPGLVIGTTNLSEGGYLGYFGKASDGMVDLQLISDLYKSEVVKVAQFLGVPEEVIARAPTGDMFDATTDEVVFGAPYDFVELYGEWLRGNVPHPSFAGDTPACRQWEEYAANLERMRAYNAHKYLGRSPAVHLDVMPCETPGGWRNPAWRA